MVGLRWRILAALALCQLPMQVESRTKASDFDQGTDAYFAAFDAALPLALKEGKAIIVMAVPNIDYKYPTKAQYEDALAMSTSASSNTAMVDIETRVEWRNISDSRKSFIAGHNQPLDRKTMKGYFTKFNGAGSSAYLVLVVDPGTYRVSRISYPLRRAHFGGDAGGKAGRSVETPVGSLQLVATEFAERDGTELAQRSPDVISGHYECTAVLVNGGGCVEQGWVGRQEVDGGTYTRVVMKSVPGLFVKIGIDQEFASFSVEPGDVLAVDGLSSEPPESSYMESDCNRMDAKTMLCAIDGISLVRSQARLEDVRSFNQGAAFPKLRELLRRAAYRPLQFKAKPSGTSQMGKIYTLSSPKP